MAALVPALVTLRSQFNMTFPHRSKASDGWIGDPAHASRFSYHNPDKNGWVHALDVTHDPANGVDIDRFTDELAASRDNRILEMIANDLYWNYRDPKWVEYYGSNEHTRHFHITVRPGITTAMDVRGWNLPSLNKVAAPSPGPAPAPGAPGDLLFLTQPYMNSDRIRNLQRVLNAWYPNVNLVEDGIFGPATDKAVRMLQSRSGLVADGVVGPATRRVLGL